MPDHYVLDFFIQHRQAALAPLVIVFTTVTAPLWLWCYSLAVGLALRQAWLPVCVGAACLLSPALKGMVARSRPDQAGWLVAETSASWPSGHALGAAALAMGLTLALPRKWAPLWWGIALLVGLSRLYVGVHWPSDVLAGWVIGATAVGLTSWSYLRSRRSRS